MSIYFVNQGDTFDIESKDGYVWSPQKDKALNKNIGYSNMAKIKVGDYILHNKNSKIVAISVAKKDCYESERPVELDFYKKITTKWNKEGYRVDTDYHYLDNPLVLSKYKKWLADHSVAKTAFTKKGTPAQTYMNDLTDEQALFLLNEIEKNQTNKATKDFVQEVIDEIITEENDDYSNTENVEIDDLLDDDSKVDDSWDNTKKKQVLKINKSSVKAKPKRDEKIAAGALKHAGYKCEADPMHKTFERKNGHQFTESHHLIPICRYSDFEYSLDVKQNIVSLCPNCHRLLHNGKLEDKKPVLDKLYKERKDALKDVGIKVSYDDLERYYR